MRADVVFIGGGLAALVAGIKLLEEGKNVIIISSGQSALHFSSGSFSLLNKINGQKVMEPLEYIDSLPDDHPYKKAGGATNISSLLEEAIDIIRQCDIEMKGSILRNHYRLTPFGVMVPAWKSLTDHLTFDSLDNNNGIERAAIIGIDGFLDFYPVFLEKGLKKIGIESNISSVNIAEFNILRQNPTEMRAPNIARLLDEDGLRRYAQAINRNIRGCDVALIPGVIGLNDSEHLKLLRSMVKCPLYTMTTIPVAVSGIRMKILLQQMFTDLGGWYLLGDTVTDGVFEGNRLIQINTANLGSSPVIADNFVLSTGGIFSRGLKSSVDKFYEPIFGLDVYASGHRFKWYDKNFYHCQPFMKFGVATDNQFRCSLEYNTIENLYAVGGVLGGNFDPLSDGVGAGVTLSSALFVAHLITGK